jgi:polyisoprenoid-binding protein YceI
MTHKKIYFTMLLALAILPAQAQKYVTEKSLVTFFSEAPVENIQADNQKTSSLFNSSTGDIAFTVPIAAFQFEKSLMQEHFNEKYMETERYPKSTFAGKITGYDASVGTEQRVTAKGKLQIHGVTKEVEIPGTIEKQGDKLVMKSSFTVKLDDYNIKIPQLLWRNIAEQIAVTITLTYKPQ